MRATKFAAILLTLALGAVFTACGNRPGGFSVKVDALGWSKSVDRVQTKTEAQTASGGDTAEASLGNVKRWQEVTVKYQGPNLNNFMDTDVLIPRPRLNIHARERKDATAYVEAYSDSLERTRQDNDPITTFRMFELDDESRAKSIQLETLEKRQYNGNPGFYFEYTSTRNNVPFRQWGILTTDGKYVIKFLLAVPQEYYEYSGSIKGKSVNVEREMESILDSFKVTGG